MNSTTSDPALAALAPGEVDLTLSLDASAGSDIVAHIAAQVQRLKSNDPRVRADQEDGVHQMRVATRRLRSALTTFRPLFDHEVTDPIRSELRWLGEVLGAARDAEVIRDHLRSAIEALPPHLVSGPVLQRVVATMTGRYRTAHSCVLVDIDSWRYFALRDGLDLLITDPPLTKIARYGEDQVLLPLVAKTYKRIRKLDARLDAVVDPRGRELILHDIRKAAKAARYAGDAMIPAYGDPAHAWAASMAAIQEHLGIHQDTVVIREQIRSLAAAALSRGEDAFTYGHLDRLEQARADQAEADYLALREEIAQPELHAWLHAG